MARRTYRELFLDTLRELSNKGKSVIANKTLREALGWDEERYWRVRKQLYDEGLVISRRGPGGTIGLKSSRESKGVSVFIAYSHVDTELKTELTKHLEPLRRLQVVDAWHDGMIAPGDEWESTISSALERADIVLLLISVDFINSTYAYEVELEAAMERQEKGEAVVIPVILRQCLWDHSPFAKLQALPKNARPVTAWPDRDESLTNVAEGVRAAAERVLAGR